METYDGNIKIEFKDIPPVRLISIISKKNSSVWERLALATKRRFFTLEESWTITIKGFKSGEFELNEVIKIPDVDDNGNKIVFDGASIPLPWLVSLLTIGILRPLGVMLIASIVHDFIYKYGHLKKEDGPLIIMQRHEADHLFRDIIETVNKLSMIGYIGWFFVRIGWVSVKYNNKPRGGDVPVFEYIFLLLVVVFFIWFGMAYDFGYIAIGAIFLYFIFYFISIFISDSK
jgi:hypothetical protein